MVCINKLYIICECGRNVFLIHKYASMGYEIIILNEQPEKLEESKSYGLRLPFIVNNGKASTI